MQIFPDYSRGYSHYDPSTEIQDLKGKVAIVTGANSGIGYETVKWLAMKGAKAGRLVYLGARDESRGKSAVEKISQSIAGHFSAGSVHWLELDVETPRRAKAGAQRFLAQETRLDILISNAGVNLFGYHTASEGGLTFNKVMSINHLGPFVLTQELLPILKRTAAEPHSDVRVIVVSSWMYKDVSAKPDFRTLEGWNAINEDGFSNSNKRYVASKLANVLFVKELQSRIDAEKVPITCLAIDPGLVNTGVHHRSFPAGIIVVLLDWVFRWFGLTSEQGSFASLFAATSPEIKALPEKWKGAYMEPYNRWTEARGFAQDKQLAKDLWACSEEVSEACLRDG